MRSDSWVVIPRWDDFQHYANRDPIWVKVYTRLMSDDAFVGLTFHQRGILQSIWLEYARANRQLSGSTLTLTRRLGGRVSTRDLEALSHAGFIEITASKPVIEVAIPEVETEPEAEKEKEELPEQGVPVAALVDISLGKAPQIQPLIDVLPPNEVKANTAKVLQGKFAALPAHFVGLAREELLAAQDVRSRVRYLNGIADRMLTEQGRRPAA